MAKTTPKPERRYVFDSSAVLALLSDEPGRDAAEEILPGALISAVNLAEVSSALCNKGLDPEEVSDNVAALGLEVVPFDTRLAYRVGELRVPTRALGLSLGDRACLVTAESLSAVAATADRVWAQLKLGIQVHVIR